MNQIMLVEIIIFAVLLLAGVIAMLVIRHKLEQYDGMGQVKKPDEDGKQPPKSLL